MTTKKKRASEWVTEVPGQLLDQGVPTSQYRLRVGGTGVTHPNHELLV